MMAAGEKRLGFVALVCAVIALTACGSSNDPAVTAASSDEGAADASMSNGGSVSGEESSAGSVTPDAAPDSAALELPEGATRVGIVQIAQGLASPNGRMTTAEGRFVSVENVDRARTLLDTVRPPLDTCTVTRRVGGSASPGSANRGDPSLDAGDTIVFTAGFGTWLTLSRTVVSGEAVYANSEPLFEAAPRRACAYLTDFRLDGAAHAMLVPWLAGVDTLVCESQYAPFDVELAARNSHTTIDRVALLARDAGVDELVPFHLSERYETHEWAAMLAAAQAIFPATRWPAAWSAEALERSGA